MSQLPPNSKPIHARYADGTPVYENEKPVRLPMSDKSPIPDQAAEGFPHTRLRWDIINQRVYQGRQFGEGGVPQYDVDFTNPTGRSGKAQKHIPLPHRQRFEQNIPGNLRAGYKRSKLHEKLTEEDYFQ